MSIVADSLSKNVMRVIRWKMGVHVCMVWFLVDLVVHSMGFDGEVVEWQSDIYVMSGTALWGESDGYLWQVKAAKVRDNIR